MDKSENKKMNKIPSSLEMLKVKYIVAKQDFNYTISQVRNGNQAALLHLDVYQSNLESIEKQLNDECEKYGYIYTEVMK